MPITFHRLSWLVAPFVLVWLLYGADRWLHSERVLRGVWIADVALSGLDRGQLERAVKSLEGRLQQQPLRVRVQGQLFALDVRELGFRLDLERIWSAAHREGRTGSLLDQLGWWVRRFRAPVRLGLHAALEPEQLDRALGAVEERAIVEPALPGSVRARGESIEPVYPRAGNELDRAGAARMLAARLRELPSGVVVNLPLRSIQPRLSRADVDAAVELARRLLSGGADLIRTVPGDHSAAPEEVRLHFSRNELSALLRSRVVGESPARLELYFDPELIEHKLRDLRPRVEVGPADATYQVDARDRLTLVPAREGVKLSAPLAAEALLQAAASPGRVAELPVVAGDPPRLDTERAQRLGIRGLVSRFTTRHACCQPRVQNIHRIADLLDGVIVVPGETFSVNDAIGPRTTKNGFVAAPSIEDGEMVDSVGGGISQFATTLFNAVFHGGYAILQRQPHTYYFSRYPMGHEATLGFPEPDLVFQNDSSAGLLIKTSYTATSITVRLYGDNGGRKVRADVSEPREVVQPPIEYLPDAELEPSQEKVREAGQIGWSVLVARVLEFPDGTSKREQRKVTYKPRPRRVEVHPCKVPKGEPGYTGKACPVEESEPVPEASEGTLAQELEPTP